jgi:pimeloyl-ACP methyl ester carboxylesterase
MRKLAAIMFTNIVCFTTLVAIILLGNLSCDNSTESKPDPLVLTMEPTHVSVYGASDGSIDLTVTGGTQPYQYLWSNGAATEDIMDISVGTYSVTVTADDGDTISDSAVITQPAQTKYYSRQVSFVSGDLTLAGTLSLPRDTSRVPAVVIANGVNMDRDGLSISPLPDWWPPIIYRTWADTLASYGIGVLRYDQRIVTPNVDPMDFELADRVDDIASAIQYLESRTEIDTSRIFIVGHSQGCAVAPLAAQREDIVAGLVLIASVAFAADTFEIELLRANNHPSFYVEAMFDSLRNNTYSTNWRLDGRGPRYWKQWIRYTEDTGSNAVNLGKPILTIHCASDELLPGDMFEKNMTVWENAASQSALIDINVYPGVTHFVLEDGTQETAIQVIYDIVDWLQQF